jgi:hypothetical protein
VRSLSETDAVASHAIPRALFVPVPLARRINVTQWNGVGCNLFTLNKLARRVLLSRAKDIIEVWSRQAVVTAKTTM